MHENCRERERGEEECERDDMLVGGGGKRETICMHPCIIFIRKGEWQRSEWQRNNRSISYSSSSCRIRSLRTVSGSHL